MKDNCAHRVVLTVSSMINATVDSIPLRYEGAVHSVVSTGRGQLTRAPHGWTPPHGPPHGDTGRIRHGMKSRKVPTAEKRHQHYIHTVHRQDATVSPK